MVRLLLVQCQLNQSCPLNTLCTKTSLVMVWLYVFVCLVTESDRYFNDTPLFFGNIFMRCICVTNAADKVSPFKWAILSLSPYTFYR